MDDRELLAHPPANRAIPTVALGIEPKHSDLANCMAGSARPVAGFEAQKAK
jgi:hypothetical protein